jgi:hypothetical protein
MPRVKISNALKKQVIERANGCCEFCRAQLRFSPNSFHIEHLQLPDLSPSQQAKILAELLTSTIHLHTHCDDDFQTLIAQEMETLPDVDESDDF